MRNQPPIGTPLFISTLPDDAVGTVAWLPDGRVCMVTVDARNRVAVWDIVTGTVVQRFAGHVPAAVNTAARNAGTDTASNRWPATRIQWSPDRRLIASVVPGDRRRVWEVVSGTEAPSAPSPPIDAWSPDGQYVAAVVDGRLGIYDLASGRLMPLRLPMVHRSRITTLAWSPDGTLLAGGTGTPNIGYPDEVEIRVWKAGSGALLVRERSNGAEWTSNLTWSPDGRLLAHASESVNLAVYAVPSWRHHGTWRSGTGATSTLAWSPDGRFVACACVTAYEIGCSAIYLWEVATGEIRFVYRGHEAREQNTHAIGSRLGDIRSSITQIAWAPDGMRIASVSSLSTREGEQFIMIRDVHIWQAGAGE